MGCLECWYSIRALILALLTVFFSLLKQSIIYGRPPSLNIAYTDCRFPEDKSSFVNARGEREMGCK